MEIYINGKITHLNKTISIADCLIQKALSKQQVVVELNGSIIQKNQYGQTVIKDQDKIEILQMIGGG